MDQVKKTENVYYKWNMYQIQYNVNSTVKKHFKLIISFRIMQAYV